MKSSINYLGNGHELSAYKYLFLADITEILAALYYVGLPLFKFLDLNGKSLKLNKGFEEKWKELIVATKYDLDEALIKFKNI